MSIQRLAPAVPLLALWLAAPTVEAGPVFRVGFSDAVRTEPATGRLVVYLIRDGAAVPPDTDPADGPFWDDPQPMYGVDVNGLKPGERAAIDDTATFFPAPLSRLAPGRYKAQAVLDLHRRDSNWRRESGNLASTIVEFTVAADGQQDQFIDLDLANTVPEPASDVAEGVEYFSIRSTLLSKFHGRDVHLRAGVVRPTNVDPARRYAAVYEVPGFGGDHTGAAAHAKHRPAPGTPDAQLADNAFWIVLDPEGPNGHHLFADSANNGPVGRALVEELIPALEAKYNLAPERTARLLRGHSSGGWSTIWLAITYPDTFGAAWSTSPDPVDFRRFQLVDIYGQDNMYFVSPFAAMGEWERAPEGGPTAARFTRPDAVVRPRDTLAPLAIGSYRESGRVAMTVEQENRIEEVLGPSNTSAQQWDSWQAVFGPRDKAGNPAALYDPLTGAIDRRTADQYRAFDIAERIRKDPGLAGLFHQRIRLLVGDADTFYLDLAVAMLKEEVDAVQFLHFPEGQHGYIKILPGYDHGSIDASPEVRGFAADMLAHLSRAGHAD